MTVGIIVDQFAAFIAPDEAGISEQYIDIQILGNILLTVITQNYKVRMFEIAVSSDAFKQDAEFIIVFS